MKDLGLGTDSWLWINRDINDKKLSISQEKYIHKVIENLKMCESK